MKLSKKDKNFIIKSYKTMSISDMARVLNTDETSVIKFLSEKNLSINSLEEKKVSSTNYKKAENSKFKYFGNFEFLDIRSLLKKEIFFFLSISLFIIVLYFRSFSGIILSDESSMYETLSKGNVDWLQRFLATDANHVVSFLIFGLNPTANRVLAILLHLVNIVLFYYLFRNFINEKILKVGIILLSSHSLIVEPITWVAANPYIYHAFLYLVIMISSFHFEKSMKWYFLIPYFSVLLILVLNGGHTNFAPIFATLFNIFILGRSIKKELIITGWLYLLIPYYSITNRATVDERIASLTTGPYLEKFINTLPFTVAKTIELIVFPFNLALFHEETMYPNYYTFARIFTIAFIVFSFYLLYKNKFIFGLYAIGFAYCIYIFSPVQISWFVAERYNYFTVFIFCTLFAAVLFKIQEKFAYLAEGIFILYFFFFLFVTFNRFDKWENSILLWEDNLRIAPDSYRVRNNLAENYNREGIYDKAIEQYKESIKRNPEFNEAYFNLAGALLKQNKLAEAEEVYKFLLNRNFNPQNVLLALAILTANRNEFSEAYQYLNLALANDPNSEYIKSLESEIKKYESNQKN